MVSLIFDTLGKQGGERENRPPRFFIFFRAKVNINIHLSDCFLHTFFWGMTFKRIFKSSHLGATSYYKGTRHVVCKVAIRILILSVLQLIIGDFIGRNYLLKVKGTS